MSASIAPDGPNDAPNQANLPDEREVHIAGVVVHVLPPQVKSVSQHISLIPNAHLHAASEDGRLVVTLEADSARHTVDQMDAIRALPGVINVVLVYQHAESESALNEEIES